MSDERVCLALILGASEFRGLGLADSPAFENSAGAVRDYLERLQGGPTTYVVESLFDSDADLTHQCEQIEALLARHDTATELLVYYVGHGLFTRDRKYFLALRSTRRPYEQSTGLLGSELAAMVMRSFINRRVFVVLDCCFAGEALREFQSDLADVVGGQTLSQLPNHGTALLLASSKHETAVSPAALPRTMFCDGLMSVLEEGIEAPEPYLTLASVADRLRTVLRTRFGVEAVPPEIHSPRQQDGDVARLPLFPNPAYAHLDHDSKLDDERPSVRIDAVDHLIGLLADPSEARHARDVLTRIARRDDSNLVRARAAAALDDVAGEEAREPPVRAEAALAIRAKPSRSRIGPGQSVTWSCTVENIGDAEVSAIELTDREGSQLRPTFTLPPGERIVVPIDKTYGTKGARERFAVLGRTSDDHLVSAEDAAPVHVRRPKPAPSQKLAAQPQRVATVVAPTPAAAATLAVPRFRAALRNAKLRPPIEDIETSRLIKLIADGERHYRIATGRLEQPADWPRRVNEWSRAVAADGADDVVLVKFIPPTPAEIVSGMARLSDRVAASIGVRIPTDEFP